MVDHKQGCIEGTKLLTQPVFVLLTQPVFVLFGHDAPRGLDTSVVDGGHLMACILPSKKLLNIPAQARMHAGGGVKEIRPVWVLSRCY